MRALWAVLLVAGVVALAPGCKRGSKPSAPESDSGSAATPTPDRPQEKIAVPTPPKIDTPHHPKNGFGTFTLGKATTYVTSPLNEDGHINYAAALNERRSKGVTPENNALVLIWKALGRSPVGETIPPGYFEKLGMPAPPAVGDYFISPQSYAAEHVDGAPDAGKEFLEKLGRVTQDVWNEKDHPDIAGWLKVNEKPLAVAIEATKRSRYYSPLIPGQTERGERNSLLSNPFPGLQLTRAIATALVGRAMRSANDGRADAAWQDLLACHRLARLVGSGSTMIECLVGVAFERIALRADLALLERTKPDAKQLQRYLADLTALPPMPELADKVDLAERFGFLDCVMLLDRYGIGYMDRLGGLGSTPTEAVDAAMKGVDWDPALEVVNRWFDRLVVALRQTNRTERVRMLEQLENDLRTHKRELANLGTLAQRLAGRDRTTGMSLIIGESVITILPLPAVRKIQDSSEQTRQTLDNVRVAFALEWFLRDNAKYPESLDHLAPKYLPHVTKDAFSGGALIYRRDGDGYLLYSVGPNGKDDGGRGADDQPPGDDLVVRIPR